MFLCPWDFPGKGTGVGCHFLLQRIFQTQGIEPGSLVLQADALPSESPGKPVENCRYQPDGILHMAKN